LLLAGGGGRGALFGALATGALGLAAGRVARDVDGFEVDAEALCPRGGFKRRLSPGWIVYGAPIPFQRARSL
jgi:hypothetical protein